MSNEVVWKTLKNGHTRTADFRSVQEPYKGITLVQGNPNASNMNKGSHYGIHKKGCRDIKRGLRQWTQGFGHAEPNILGLMHFDTIKEALPETIPCYAYESPEYEQQIKDCEEGNMKIGDENQFVYIYPCCKNANCGGD
tara:strand:- start:7989 stop:8405 length:417 start_codon:yes stop_codon:yes gene_type:complete